MAENLTLINTDNIPTKTSGPWTKLALSIINECPKIKKDREREILFDRFGIGKNAKTLHSIGQKYGVTRERIRQIVNNAVRKIQKNCESPDTKVKIEKIEAAVSANGGLVTKELLFTKLTGEDKLEQNAVKFVTSLSTNLEPIKESNTLRQGWAEKSIKSSKIKNVAKKATDLLKEKNTVMSTGEIAKSIGEDESQLKAILTDVKAVMQTDGNGWGLASWPHVNPKSIRDKSKYIMVRHGKPIHYAELTKKIGDMGTKNVTKQSVHNELIKNADFVLVGRGIYALTEWGYEPGVVEEVIVAVLAEAGKPLHKDEIIVKVLEKRIVKASTIILNLQKPRFKRVGKAVYTIN